MAATAVSLITGLQPLPPDPATPNLLWYLEATGATAVEMPRSRERAFCCGGGGARAFMEETIGTRIAVERSREAIGTGAQVIATACPFCTTMLSDGVASEGADVRVTDVATLMLEAVRRGGE